MKSLTIKELLLDVITGEWGKEPQGLNDIKVIRTTNFSNDGRLDLEKEVVLRTIDEKKVSAKKLKCGDIIIEKSGGSPDQPVGRVVYFDLKEDTYLCNNFTSILRPNRQKVVNKYLFYYLFYKHQTKAVLKFQNKTTGIINLKLDHYLKKLRIRLPSQEVQRKTVFVLDKTQELIDKRKAQIEALDQLTKSLFLEMFGHLEGEKQPLSAYCQINPSKKEAEKIDDDQLVTFLSMSSVSDKGEIDLSTVKKIKDVRNGFTYFKDDDVLFAKITPCMENGKGAIARNLVNGIGFGSTEFHVLRPKANVNSYWLYYLTVLPSFRRLAQKNMTGSAGQKRVPKQFFDQYKVVLPPIERQNRFAEIIRKVEDQKAMLEQSLTELQNNFQALLQRAFRGELFLDQQEQPEQIRGG